MADFSRSLAISPPDAFDGEHLRGDTVTVQSGQPLRKFRGDKRKVFQNTEVAELCGSALREAYGETQHINKAIADDSGMSARAAENWVRGDNPMSLVAFLNCFHNNAAFNAQARKLLLMERELNPQFEVEMAKLIQTAQRLAEMRS